MKEQCTLGEALVGFAAIIILFLLAAWLEGLEASLY